MVNMLTLFLVRSEGSSNRPVRIQIESILYRFSQYRPYAIVKIFLFSLPHFYKQQSLQIRH